MKKILFTILLLTGILACKVQAQTTSVWTNDYRTKTYNALDAELKPILPDEALRKPLVTYVVEHYKAILPNGLESISADSLTRLSMKLGKEYSFSHPGKLGGLTVPPTPWTPAVEQILREGILRSWPKTDLENGNKFCNCYIRKLKIKYPEKLLLPPPHDVIETAATECKAELNRPANGGTVWTAAYEAEGYKIINEQLKIFFPDSTARKDLATYMIKRYKAELPNGLEAITPDSLTKLSQKIGVDYYAQHAGEVKNLTASPQLWTPAIEKGMRYGFLNEWSKRGLVNGDQYCDCYIRKLKVKYPAKVPLPPPNDVIKTIDTECKAELKKH